MLLHKHLDTQRLLHTDAFTHRHFYTQTLLHTEDLYTQTLLHTEHFYTQTLLHAETVTHRSFYTQTLLHTEAFTQRNFYTQTLLHTNFYTQTLLQRPQRPDGSVKSQFYLSFWRSNLISCERVAIGNTEIAILLQFLAIEPHFVRNGCAREPGKSQFYFRIQFLAIEPHFVRNGCAGHQKSQFYFSFWRSNLISCERVAIGRFANRNFTSAFGDRTSFRAKGLRFVPSRWHCPAPSREK